MTGCLMQGTSAQSGGWMLANAQTATDTARSGSPANEGGATVGNRNGASRAGVGGSTSTGIGTSGTSSRGTSDTEANGAGTLGATNQSGSTVGGGATAGAIAGSSTEPRNTSASGAARNNNNAAGASASAAGSYQLTGVKNPTQYANKRVEVVGTRSNARNGGNQMLSVTSVRVLGDSCQ